MITIARASGARTALTLSKVAAEFAQPEPLVIRSHEELVAMFGEGSEIVEWAKDNVGSRKVDADDQ